MGVFCILAENRMEEYTHIFSQDILGIPRKTEKDRKEAWLKCSSYTHRTIKHENHPHRALRLVGLRVGQFT